MLGIRLAPLDHTQVNVVSILLGEFGALALDQFGPAGGVGQHRVLDHVLRDGFYQRVVGDGLHEDGAVVVLRGGRDINLQRERGAFLLETVVNVLDGLEPGHARVVDVVRFVIQHDQLFDITHDHAQVDFGVGGRAAGTRTQEVVSQVFVFWRWGDVVAGVDPVDVGQEDVASRARDAHLVLAVQGQLEVVPPVAAVHAVVGDYRIIEEDAQPLEIPMDAVQHDDVGRDNQKVPRQFRFRLVELVVEAPGQYQAQYLGLAGAGRHLDDVAAPRLVEHAGGDQAGTVVAHQVELVLRAGHVVEVDDRLQRLTLREVVLELDHDALTAGPSPIGRGEQVSRVEPPVEQAAAGVGRAGVAAAAPLLDLAAQLRHEGWHELVHAGVAQGLVGREPAQRRVKDGVGRFGEIRMQGHVPRPRSSS